MTSRRRRLCQLIALIAAVLAVFGRANAVSRALRVGGEFQVNTHTPSMQAYMSIAVETSGDFVVVWVSYDQDGEGYGVFGQRFSASGVPSGTEFQVSTYTPGDQGGGAGSVAVSSGAHGDFIVLWQSLDTSGYGIFGRRYDGTGTPIGVEFQVNSYTTGVESLPAVGRASNDDFTVAWTDSSGRDGFDKGVFARRFTSSGAALSDDFQINTYTDSVEGLLGPHLALDADGNIIAVWAAFDRDGSASAVVGRRFDSSGEALGAEFQINEFTSGPQLSPSVAAAPAGNFVVIWGSVLSQDGSSCSVRARRYDSSGDAIGGEFQVNSFTVGCQDALRNAVFADENAGFVAVWSSENQDSSSFGVFGQQFSGEGTLLGTEFQINTYTPNSQRIPVIAGNSDGDFVVAWQSNLEDGSYLGVFAQRFHAACPLNIDTGCTTSFEKGTLFIKENTAGKEKLIATMVKGPALTQTALGNPLNSGGTVYSLCIYDDAGKLAGGTNGAMVLDRAGDACTGLPCWEPVGADPPGGKGYKYKDAALAADGALKLLYKGGDAGKSKAIIKGKGSNLPDGIPAALQTTTFATVQLRSSDGICLSVVVDDIKKQEPAFFKAKLSAP